VSGRQVLDELEGIWKGEVAVDWRYCLAHYPEISGVLVGIRTEHLPNTSVTVCY
jgi:hypothetical protein